MFSVNYLAVIVGTVANFVVGFLWYGPVFGKAWMELIGVKEDEIKGSDAAKAMAVSAVTAFISVLTLAVIARLASITGALPGLALGLAVAVGFLATTQLSTYAYESKSTRLFLINSGYRVVVFAIAGLVIGVW